VSIWSRIRLILNARASAAVDRAEDADSLLDYAYAQQQEMLCGVRRGLVDVATAKHQLERQASGLREQSRRFDEQARKAVASGREDLARRALAQKHATERQAAALDPQLAEVVEDERRLMSTERELTLRVDEFRQQRQMLKARHAAADAQVRITELLGGVSEEFAELHMAVGRVEERTDRLRARATALDALLESGVLEAPGGEVRLIERELDRLEIERAVEAELAALRGEPADLSPPALADFVR
jgi:phage shock protein A